MARQVAILLSYHFWKRGNLADVVAAFPSKPVVFADSGAFSAATAGAVIKREEYSAWLTAWRKEIDIACTLDVIGDAAATLRSTRELEADGHKILPVFHVGEPWYYLTDLCKEYPYVGLGGMVPWTTRRAAVGRWLIQCMKQGRPYGTQFHGLGQTNWRTLADLPFYSVDSSSWASGDRYGYLALWDPQAGRLVSFNAGNRAPARVYSVGHLFRAHGLEPSAYIDPHYGRQWPDKTKPVVQLRAERWTMREANLRAWLQVEDWSRARWGNLTVPGMPDGPWIFLVCMNWEHITAIASWMHKLAALEAQSV